MLDPGQILKQIGDLDQFARDHPRTNAAAKALFHAGAQLHANVSVTGLEPRGADPSRAIRLAFQAGSESQVPPSNSPHNREPHRLNFILLRHYPDP